ncbi:retrovirus-related pol polyprotein from transposon TNT 1-94 [Tanacetum coccineum]
MHSSLNDQNLQKLRFLPRINLSKTSREDKVMPNKPVKASIRTKLITSSQPHVIYQENVNSSANGRSNLFMFLEIVRFGNDHIATILGYCDLQWNDHEDIGKLGAKGDIGFFIGYYANSCAYRVYNLRIKKIMETMSVTFDELSAMAFEQCNSKPALQGMTSGQITMYDDYIGGHPSTATRTAMDAQAPQVLQTLMASTTTANTTLIPTNSSPQATDILNTSYDVAELEPEQQHNTFVNPFAPPNTSAAESSSSQYVDPWNMHTFYQPYPHEYQWTKDHPLEQVIREPSRSVLTRNQLRTNGDMFIYALIVSTMEPRNVKEAMTDPAWINSMQEELVQFKRLDAPDNIKPLKLK